jgi:hypothetical protein
MDISNVRKQIIDELDATAGEQKEAHTLSTDVVLSALHRLGYRIVPSIIKVEGNHINDFNRVVARGCAQGDITCSKLHLSSDGKRRPCGNHMIYQVEEQDISGASIVQSLTSEGWVIIPPR